MSETLGTTLDVPVAQAAPLSSELALRIRGGDYHGRIVRIRASQCTVGSAPDCTLRLSGAGLRPLHCIILRGEAGATVRRWSPDTQLNGRAFSDALLMPGDRLGIGPIELEVLDDAELTQNRRPEAAASLPVGELAGEIVSQLRRDLRRDKDVRKRKVERQRLRQSQRRIKSLEAELERLQAGVNSMVALDQSPAPQQPQEDAQAELQANRDAWASERQSLVNKAEEHERSVRRLEATLDEFRKADQTHLAAAAAEREQFAQELDAQRQQLQAREAELSQLKSQCEELVGSAQFHQQAEAAAHTAVRELQERIAALEAAANEQSLGAEALESAQRQVHNLFAEGERLREELHQANCSLAAAQCRLAEQEAALTAFRELHQHAIAELELECKTLQAQLTDAQAKFDEQSGRLNELESQAIAASENCLRISELETQLESQCQEVHAARAAKEELQNVAAQSSIEWSQREQELTQRVECLERLAGNLEDELRSAAGSPDKIQLAEEHRQNLERQLSTVQQRWSEQRQALEDQALSAHQQVQDLENQVVSMRDALNSAHGQVRERDQLLTQLRDEVQQQMGAWQQERVQLLEQLAAGRPDESEAWPAPQAIPQQQSFPPGDAAEDEPDDDRYVDRQMLAGGHALVETEEPCQPGEFQHGNDASVSNDGGVGNVLARLEAAGIWRNQEDAPLAPCAEAEMQAADESQTPDSTEVAVQAEVEPVPSWRESSQIADAETTGDDNAAPPEIACEVQSNDVQNAEADDAGPQTPPASTGHDEEESIETYMARLLKRVRGDAVADAFVVQHAPAQAMPESSTEAVDQASVQPAESAAAESTDYLPRKSAPEQAADVAAMRELAVSTTRQAINHSNERRFQQRSLATTLAAGALACLGAGLYGWGYATGNWIAWTGSAASILASGVLALRRLKMRSRTVPLPVADQPTAPTAESGS